MPIFYLNVFTVSRTAGRSAIAAASYCSRSKLWDERNGRDVDFSSLGDHEYSEIILPEGANEAWSDRGRLWNEVELVEKRDDAQVAREIEIVIPEGLSVGQGVDLAREFFREQFVERGMIVDLNIHRATGSDGIERLYVQTLFSMREIISDGFGKKRTDWKDSKLFSKWRERWAQLSNKHLLAAGYARMIGAGANAGRGRRLESFFGSVESDRSAENFEIAWRNGERLYAEPELAFEGLTATSPAFSRQEMVEFVKRNTAGDEQFNAALARLECSVDLVRLPGGERFSTRKLFASLQAAGAAGREGDEASGTAFENAEEQERRTLGEALSLWEKAGLKVRGVGQTYETAKAFEKKTGIKSVGVHGLLGRWKKKQDLLLVNDVLVVNDAAQLSERQKEWMLRATRAAKARLVLVDGDGMVEIEGGAIGLSVEALNETAFG